MIYQWVIKKGWIVHKSAVKPGCWAFKLNEAGTAIHVELVSRNPAIAIGASGGGPHVKTIDDAIRDNAFIKPRPLATWGGVGSWVFADPYWKDELGEVA